MRSAQMMTYAEAAWVREYVWTKAMRATFAQVPAIYSKCPCWRARHHGAALPPVQLDLIDILAEMGVCA